MATSPMRSRRLKVACELGVVGIRRASLRRMSHSGVGVLGAGRFPVAMATCPRPLRPIATLRWFSRCRGSAAANRPVMVRDAA